MVVREGGEVKGIQGIAVQENGTTQVSMADTLNIVGGGTVTDVGGVATINIPYGVEWIREDVPAGSATYTFVNSPATSTSFLVFTDSGTLLFSGIDYTYNPTTETITFLSLGNNESAYIWNAHATVSGGGIGDMVKAVYDPTNINSSAFDYNNFVNTPTIPTKTSDLINDSGFIDSSDLPDLSGYQTKSNLKTDLTDNSDTYYPSQKAVKTAIDAMGDVKGPSSSIDGNIVLFDGVTGKQIRDSLLKIVVTGAQPAGSPCSVYYDSGVITIYTGQVEDNILLEDGDNLIMENGNNLILEY